MKIPMRICTNPTVINCGVCTAAHIANQHPLLLQQMANFPLAVCRSQMEVLLHEPWQCPTPASSVMWWRVGVNVHPPSDTMNSCCACLGDGVTRKALFKKHPVMSLSVYFQSLLAEVERPSHFGTYMLYLSMARIEGHIFWTPCPIVVLSLWHVALRFRVFACWNNTVMVKVCVGRR